MTRRAAGLPPEAVLVCEQPWCHRASSVASWRIQAQIEALQQQSGDAVDCVMRLAPLHREDVERRLRETDAELTRLLRASAGAEHPTIH
jgi:hypothetical protein